MIVVDKSAIVAIVFGEPERKAFIHVLEETDKALISTVSVLEARMVVHGRRGQRAVVLVDDLLRLPVFEWVAPERLETDAAYAASSRREGLLLRASHRTGHAGHASGSLD